MTERKRENPHKNPNKILEILLGFILMSKRNFTGMGQNTCVVISSISAPASTLNQLTIVKIHHVGVAPISTSRFTFGLGVIQRLAI
jgi:hypothetical protein